MSGNECTDHPCTCENPRGAEVVVTGLPNVQLLACKLCGVLLWDIEAHYAHAHAAEVRSTDTTAQTVQGRPVGGDPSFGQKITLTTNHEIRRQP